MENSKIETLIRILEQAHTATISAIPELRDLGVDPEVMKRSLGELRSDVLIAQLALAIEMRRRERVEGSEGESGESR